ncbi:hypothetical protein HDU87_003528 [Geranomyces variabilis]|uniref:Uncharacterized protein n=1 Tax=Geranomyces variabilis TaxID=109894 RepID=A0AAD5TKL6_9FUNG|nr:hypothetical protein HDU87_003528 [Geranomyces variabilis]
MTDAGKTTVPTTAAVVPAAAMVQKFDVLCARWKESQELIAQLTAIVDSLKSQLPSSAKTTASSSKPSSRTSPTTTADAPTIILDDDLPASGAAFVPLPHDDNTQRHPPPSHTPPPLPPPNLPVPTIPPPRSSSAAAAQPQQLSYDTRYMELQKENQMLNQHIKQCEGTLEVVMSKFRSQAQAFQKEKHDFQLKLERSLRDERQTILQLRGENAALQTQLGTCLSVMRQAVAADDDNVDVLLAGLMRENEGLREMMGMRAPRCASGSEGGESHVGVQGLSSADARTAQAV